MPKSRTRPRAARPRPLPNDSIKKAVSRALEVMKASSDRQMDKILELEAQGRRIINGGQVSSYGDDGKCDFEFTDWNTDEVIVAGRGTLAESEAMIDQADPDGRFFHIDHLYADGFEESTKIGPYGAPAPEGMPTGLWEAIVHWAESADGADVAAVTGWSTARVDEYRTDI